MLGPISLIAILGLALVGVLVATGRRAWTARKSLAVISLVLLSFASTGLLKESINIWTVSLVVISIYQAVSITRLVKDRADYKDSKHWNFIRHNVRQTTLWLGGIQLVVANIYLLLDYYGQTAVIISVPALYVLAALQLAVAVVLTWSARRQLQTTRARSAELNIHDSGLPSVTVAIPARNEDAQLEACLTAVLASNYPKLEVLVLDDCSSDKTPEIIRNFAQSGVRFIGYEPGEEPSADSAWLAKNLAYDRLYRQASGSLILFCGVDIRLGRNSIRQLVAIMQRRQKTMVCVLPQNTRATRLPVVQAMRYARSGGFAAVKRSVTPEAHFARAAAAVIDGYGFIRSEFMNKSDKQGKDLRISSDKPSAEQYDTAILTRYPQLHRRIEMVLAVTVAEAVFLLTPLAVALGSLVTLHVALFAIAGLAFWLNLRAFSNLQRAIFPNLTQPAGLDFLSAVMTEIAILHYSMYKYEFSEVYWKGRNICYPVMRAIPHLPHLPKLP